MRNSYICFLIIILFISCVSDAPDYQETNIYKGSIEELDNESIFSFIIMSDNKGDSITEKPFERMVSWSAESDKRFVIGLGDHVKKGRENPFLTFIKEDLWWSNNFYPNIADGENQYYGKGQGDWGAGYPLLEIAGLFNRENTTIRENKSEYYSKIRIDDKYTVHLIQLHFSDTPFFSNLAFKQDSKDYMIRILDSISKGDTDIIIIAAHSISGVWIDKLNSTEQDIVMQKADLVLSATTHIFKIIDVPGYYSYNEKDDKKTISRNGALCINTGSITNAAGSCPDGYVEVHILEEPYRLIVQYINAENENRVSAAAVIQKHHP